MPDKNFEHLEQGDFVERLRTSMGGHVAEFSLHQAELSTDASAEPKPDEAAYIVTEQNMDTTVGKILLENIEDGSADVSINTPDGQTMEEPLLREAIPAAMEDAKVDKATIVFDDNATNVPPSKLANSGFQKQGDDHTLHLR